MVQIDQLKLVLLCKRLKACVQAASPFCASCVMLIDIVFFTWHKLLNSPVRACGATLLWTLEVCVECIAMSLLAAKRRIVFARCSQLACVIVLLGGRSTTGSADTIEAEEAFASEL